MPCPCPQVLIGLLKAGEATAKGANRALEQLKEKEEAEKEAEAAKTRGLFSRLRKKKEKPAEKKEKEAAPVRQPVSIAPRGLPAP